MGSVSWVGPCCFILLLYSMYRGYRIFSSGGDWFVYDPSVGLIVACLETALEAHDLVDSILVGVTESVAV